MSKFTDTSKNSIDTVVNSQTRDDNTLYNDWVKTVLVCLPFGAISFFTAIWFEKVSGQETLFDLVVLPIAVVAIIIPGIVLLFRPSSLRLVVSFVCLGMSAFFISKFTQILFFLPETMDPLYQMTESSVWLSVVYLLAFLIPTMRIGHVIAIVFTIVVAIISVVYVWLSFSNDLVNWGVIYALVQINLSILVCLFITFTFMRFREQFDVTKDQEAIANKLARYDRLTGLPNRLMLQEELELYINNPATDTLALLFIDIDGFKSVNDSLGHQYGDELLQHIAQRLNRTLIECNNIKKQEQNPNHDLVTRISGDEFVFVIRDVKNKLHAESVAQSIVETFRSPFNLSGEYVSITSSIGVCFYPQDGQDSTNLINNADIAMYEAKQSGKNKYCFYEESMTLAAKEERELSQNLRVALGNNEFELYFQPIFNLQTQEVDNFEALLRWNHPERGMISPDVFIPIAEKAGLIVPIDRWVIKEACTKAKAWQSFLPGVSVSVNMSAVQFGMLDVADYILDALASSDLAHDLLELEVTESVVIENIHNSSKYLNQLRSQGIKTAIDDFGTGYSSLAYLQDLPADTVKIDKSFINKLATDNAEFTEKLITVIIELSKHLNRRIVAEGIETPKQLDWLKNADCDLGQGYYFSKPIPYDELLLKYGSHESQLQKQFDSLNTPVGVTAPF